MNKNLNMNDFKLTPVTYDMELDASTEGEKVIVVCEKVPVAEQEVLIRSILNEFENLSFDTKLKILKVMYLDNYTNYDPYHTLSEKDILKAIDVTPSMLMWELETVGLYVEVERNFKQEFALKREEERSAAFGIQLLILFLSELIEAFATSQKEKAETSTNEATNLLSKLEHEIQEGKYDNVVSLMKDMQKSQSTKF